MISNIEGVGGEVIQFFVFLGVLVVCFLLWLSTRVRNTDEPFFSTVYVLERRYGRNRLEDDHNRMSSITAPPNESDANEAVITQVDTENVIAGPSRVYDSSACENANNLCDFERASGSNDANESSLPESTKSKCIDEQNTGSQSLECDVKIRLKYLNDDSRQVDAILSEKLADFKKRTFPEELAAKKIIRLIFNGRVLRDDNVALQSYGLFDDCVVHCLILNEKQRQPSNSEQADQSQQHFTPNNESTSTPEWNLSKLFCFMVVGILSLTWYCRFQFAALFTFTSTSFLLGLTIIFLCSLYGTFYVDSVPLNSIG